MANAAVEIFARTLTYLFVIGAAGCVVVVPIVAYRLARVLVEADAPGEQ